MEFGEITQNKSYYDVQGHSRSPMSVPVESPYMRFPIIDNWYPISYRFEVIAYYCSNFGRKNGHFAFLNHP